MPLPLMQPGADGLDHLITDEMAITEPELIMVPQRQGPAAAWNCVLCFRKTVAERFGPTTGDGREQLRRQREIEGTMQLLIREVRSSLIDRLDRLGEKQNLLAMGINPFPQAFQEGMGGWETLTA